MIRLLRRLAVMLAAYVAAGCAIVPLGILLLTLIYSDYPTFTAMLLGNVLLALVLLLIVAFAPVFFIVSIAEWKRIRSWRYFVTAGAMTAIIILLALGIIPGPGGGNLAVCVLVLAGGTVGGFIYWAVAGRNSGALRDAWSAMRFSL